MQRLLRESLDEGAWGYSTGLEYAQEQAATRGGDHALWRGARRSTRPTRGSGTTAPPTRSRRRSERARRQTRLQVSHLVPRNGIEESRRCVEVVEHAHDAGQDVAFDMHTRASG